MKKLLFILSFILSLNISQAFSSEIVVKSTTNRGDIHVGDYWIAEDFAAGFVALNNHVNIDYRGEYQAKHEPEPDINIFMRGYTKFSAPFPLGVNILYSYYPMAYTKQPENKPSKMQINQRPMMPQDASLDDEWQNYDIIAVASQTYVEELNKFGIKAVYVPQFTNPDKFYPDPDKELANDILFVGSNWHDRTSLRYAIENGFDVAVYGFNWDGIIPQEMYKGAYIANEELNKYYSSAKIVLNDHRPDMKSFGFINNRIYDATAAGALVISDYMPEIKQAYGDSIPMYNTREELGELLKYYLEHEEERKEKAEKARNITLRYFTNKVVAQRILEVVENAKNH